MVSHSSCNRPAKCIGNHIFSASVDAPPTQNSRVLNSGRCQRSGRISLRRTEPPDSDLHARLNVGALEQSGSRSLSASLLFGCRKIQNELRCAGDPERNRGSIIRPNDLGLASDGGSVLVIGDCDRQSLQSKIALRFDQLNNVSITQSRLQWPPNRQRKSSVW